MRIVDIYALGANIWLVAMWMKHDGPDWVAVGMAVLWVAGLVWINLRRAQNSDSLRDRQPKRSRGA